METPLDEIDCLARSNHRAGVMSVDLLADAVASYPAGYLYEQAADPSHVSGQSPFHSEPDSSNDGRVTLVGSLYSEK